MRATICHNKALSHQDLPGVAIFPVSGPAKRNEPQQVLVVVEPNAIIPLHTHETDAEMIIVAGNGTVRSEDLAANGQQVGPGCCVFFARMKAHGFEAGPEGLSFLSKNGGIVDGQGDWDITFAS